MSDGLPGSGDTPPGRGPDPDPELAVLVDSLGAAGLEGVALALVLGSGLGDFAERLRGARSIPYGDLPGMPASGVAGHAGRLVMGELAGVRVVVQQGRVHLYEGRGPREVSRCVRALARLGVRGLVLSNAAGGLHRSWAPGTLMRLEDHLNLQGASPLGRLEVGAGTPYDRDFAGALDEGARRAGVEIERGVYAGLPGPSYETPSEVRLLRELGADAVGMSTVAEALAGHAEGLRVAGLSLVTNPAAGLAPGPLSHAEVVAAGRAAADRVARWLEAAIGPLADVA